jgi:hypothetical protein
MMGFFRKAPLQRFTVRETSPGINYGELDKPLYWHWSIEARSARAAEATVRKANTGGRDQIVVQPLG